MSCDPFCVLVDSAHDWVALHRMQGRRAPRVGIDWTLDSGTHALTVRVDGEIVVRVGGPSLECAARRGLAAWRGWAEDSEAGITDSLERSLKLPANTNEAAP